MKSTTNGSRQFMTSARYILEDLNDVILGEDEVVISLDITSLFTSFDLDLVKNETGKLMQGHYLHKPMGTKAVYELLEMCLRMQSWRFRTWC